MRPDLRYERQTVVWLKIIVALVVAVIVLGVGFIGWRSYHNDGRCVAALGVGAKWDGRDLCTPPPLRVRGLM